MEERKIRSRPFENSLSALAQVALTETRVFLDRLLRMPGIRLRREPDLGWTSELSSYELRNAIVTCDRY